MTYYAILSTIYSLPTSNSQLPTTTSYLPLTSYFYIMPNQATGPDPKLLLQLTTMAMPYGKCKGTLLYRLPVSYLEWFCRKGFPDGKLGMLLQTMYEIKLNGLDYLLDPLKKPIPKP